MPAAVAAGGTDLTQASSDFGRGELGGNALEQLFYSARSYNVWRPEKVPEDVLKAIYDMARWGPTSANICPARFVFVTSPQAKARLKPHLFDTNTDKVEAASCCVIVARDTRFTEKVPELFPGREFIATFFEMDPVAHKDAYTRNTTLQGAYLILAARALGVDCGPMSGFSQSGVDGEFFPDGRWQSDFLINLGYGNDAEVWPRNPRLSFDDACQIL